MPPSGPRSARVKISQPGAWINRHQNIHQPIDRLYDVWNPPQPVEDILGDLRRTVTALQGIIGDAAQDNMRLRAIGGGWSLSPVVATNGRLVNTRPLNWFFPLGAQSIVPEYAGDRKRLLFLQCGVSVQEANDHFFQRGMALRTSGASNGQTIAGAVATGTHGSAFSFGAMQDSVLGIHLVVSPTRVIWLERASHPVVTDGFLARLGAEPVRDDALFNAALVSFGSFGLIHGLLVEAEPAYKLAAACRIMPFDAALRHAMDTLEFDALPLPHPGETPYHFAVMINPHNRAAGAYVTTMYRQSCPDGYQPAPTPAGGLGPGDDLLAAVGAVANFVPGTAAVAVNALVNQVYPAPFDRTGIPGEVFCTTFTQGKGMSTEIGVPLEYTTRALDILLGLPEANEYPGLIAMRYVKGSRATLAFTRYPITCTIELPGVFSNGTERYYRRVWEELERAEIPFTLHWGQMGNYSPGHVRNMYGDAAVDSWIRARERLLEPRMRRVFTSPFLESCGLG